MDRLRTNLAYWCLLLMYWLLPVNSLPPRRPRGSKWNDLRVIAVNKQLNLWKSKRRPISLSDSPNKKEPKN